MLPNLSQLRIRDATVPTAGTGGGPGGGDGAGHEVYNQDDAMAEVLKHLKRLEPSAVPRNRQMGCLIRMSLNMRPTWVRFDFEVQIRNHGNTLPNAQTIRVPLINAFMTTFLQSLPTQPDQHTIDEIRSITQVTNEKIFLDSNPSSGPDDGAVYAMSSRFANLDQARACDAFQALHDEWTTSDDVEAFMNELQGALFSALMITALPKTYETLATRCGPGNNKFAIAMVVAVRDVDVPETFPVQGVDKRSQQFLDDLRAQEKERREGN